MRDTYRVVLGGSMATYSENRVTLETPEQLWRGHCTDRVTTTAVEDTQTLSMSHVSKNVSHLKGQKRPQYLGNEEKDTRVLDDDVSGGFVKDHLIKDVDDLTHKLIVLLLG